MLSQAAAARKADIVQTAGIGRSTVADYERAARTPNPDNLTAIRSTFEVAGIEFIDPNGGGPGVRLRE